MMEHQRIVAKMGRPSGDLPGQIQSVYAHWRKEVVAGLVMGYVSRHDHAVLDFRLSRPGGARDEDDAHAMCPRRCGITRDTSSAWRCSMSGVITCLTAG
jgi:hypothetical protein